MHLIKDENGNLVQHGHEHTPEHSHEHTHADGVTHTHAHTHGDGDHTHSHGDCGSCEGGDCKKETIALLTYMLQHNEHHAAELDQMAEGKYAPWTGTYFGKRRNEMIYQISNDITRRQNYVSCNSI